MATMEDLTSCYTNTINNVMKEAKQIMESVWGPELVQTRYKILQEVNKTHMSK
jgi:hypothetical protein